MGEELGDAVSLLYVLDDGVRAKDERTAAPGARGVRSEGLPGARPLTLRPLPTNPEENP